MNLGNVQVGPRDRGEFAYSEQAKSNAANISCKIGEEKGSVSKNAQKLTTNSAISGNSRARGRLGVGIRRCELHSVPPSENRHYQRDDRGNERLICSISSRLWSNSSRVAR